MSYSQKRKRPSSSYRGTGRTAKKSRALYAVMAGPAYRVPSARSTVPGEMKQFDCDLTTFPLAAVTTTWVAGTVVDPATTINLGSAAVANPNCLFAPTVGAALNQRIGRAVKLMKCKVTGTITCAPQAAQGAADASAKVRILLVMDKQTNAAQMTAAQLLRDASGASTTISSYQNPDNFGRFRVLKDKMISIADLNLAGSPTAGDVIQGSFMRTFKMSYRFKKPVEVHFNATNGGTVADIVDNSLHLIIGASTVAFVPSVAYYTRVSFKE